MKSNRRLYPEKETSCTWRSPLTSRPTHLHIKMGNLGTPSSAFCIWSFSSRRTASQSCPSASPRRTGEAGVGTARPRRGEFAVTLHFSQLPWARDKPRSPQGRGYSRAPKPQRKRNRRKSLRGRARPCGSTVIISQVTQGRKKKPHDLAKPTKTQNRSISVRHRSHVSAEDPQAKKMPFPARKASGLHPQPVFGQSCFIFTVKNALQSQLQT